MTPIPPQAPPNSRKKGGIPKGEFCPGCGTVSTGVHLDRELLPPINPATAGGFWPDGEFDYEPPKGLP